MDIMSLLVEAISGGVGGNIAGAAMKDKSLGTVGNSIAGIVGGGLGGPSCKPSRGPQQRAVVEWIFKASWQT